MKYWRDFTRPRDRLCSYGTGAGEAATLAMLGEGIVGAEIASGGFLAVDALAYGGAAGGFGAALSTALPYVSAAGSVVSAAGTFMAGQQQADMARHNAALMEREAEATRTATEIEVQRQRRRTKIAGAAARAQIAGSGISEEGSPLLSEAAIDELADLDEAAIRQAGSAAEARALGQAAADRMAATGFKRGGYFGAGSNLLTGASNFYRTQRGYSSGMGL